MLFLSLFSYRFRKILYKETSEIQWITTVTVQVYCQPMRRAHSIEELSIGYSMFCVGYECIFHNEQNIV